jgi:hypothetical protein
MSHIQMRSIWALTPGKVVELACNGPLTLAAVPAVESVVPVLGELSPVAEEEIIAVELGGW